MRSSSTVLPPWSPPEKESLMKEVGGAKWLMYISVVNEAFGRYARHFFLVGLNSTMTGFILNSWVVLHNVLLIWRLIFGDFPTVWRTVLENYWNCLIQHGERLPFEFKCDISIDFPTMC